LHRHRFGFGAPLTGPLGPYYDGWGYTDPYYQSSYAYPDGPYPGGAVAEIPSGFSPPVVRHRGCESESVTVPSARGGKRSRNVNRLRCYSNRATSESEFALSKPWSTHAAVAGRA